MKKQTAQVYLQRSEFSFGDGANAPSAAERSCKAATVFEEDGLRPDASDGEKAKMKKQTAQVHLQRSESSFGDKAKMKNATK